MGDTWLGSKIITTSNKELLVTKGIATRSKKLVAPGIATSNKKLLVTGFDAWKLWPRRILAQSTDGAKLVQRLCGFRISSFG